MQFRDQVSMPLCDLVQKHLQYTWPFETEPVSGVQYVCHFLEKSTRNEERVHDSVGARSRGIIIIIDECRCDASERGWHSWIRYHISVATTGSYAVDAPTAVEVGVNLIPQLTWKVSKAAKFRPKSSTGLRVSGSKLAWHVVDPAEENCAGTLPAIDSLLNQRQSSFLRGLSRGINRKAYVCADQRRWSNLDKAQGRRSIGKPLGSLHQLRIKSHITTFR